MASLCRGDAGWLDRAGSPRRYGGRDRRGSGPTRPVATGALDPEGLDSTESGSPPFEVSVTGRCRRQMQLPDASAEPVERDRDMDILVGVDTDGDVAYPAPGASCCSWPSPPSCSMVVMATARRASGQDCDGASCQAPMRSLLVWPATTTPSRTRVDRSTQRHGASHCPGSGPALDGAGPIIAVIPTRSTGSRMSASRNRPDDHDDTVSPAEPGSIDPRSAPASASADRHTRAIARERRCSWAWTSARPTPRASYRRWMAPSWPGPAGRTMCRCPTRAQAEHDADAVWWNDLCTITRELTAAVDADRVVALGVSGLGPAFVPLDAHDRPLRPAILYGIDTRASAEIEELHRALRCRTNCRAMRRPGHQPVGRPQGPLGPAP